MPEPTTKNEEFAGIFKKIINLILKTKQDQQIAIGKIETTHQLLSQKIQDDYVVGLKRLQEQVRELFVILEKKNKETSANQEELLNFLKQETTKAVNQKLEEMSEKTNAGIERIGILEQSTAKTMNQKLKELEIEQVNFLDKKIAEIENSKDANEKRVTQNILSQIKIPNIEEVEERVERNLPKLGAAVRDGLELLQDSERLDISAIKGLSELQEKVDLAAKMESRRVIAGPSANAVQYVDLSSQLDGSTKTFNTPKYRHALLLIGTQFPILFRPTTDFTLGNGKITLTAEVSAPATGQSLVMLYIK